MKIFKTLSKRGLALFLVLTMCVSLLPTTALAAEAAEALHTHNEDGWACVEESQLICGYEQEHTHDEACWTASEASGEPVCGLAESEGHLHGEACYTEETVQVCDLEVSEEHEHGEACFVTETVLSCGQEEAEGHTHGEDCFAAGETVLTCELEEHQHGEACYASVWTCTEPTADITRFLQAVKDIPEDITAENVEEAEVKIAEAIEAYQHLGGAEKSNASVVRAYDVILAAEIAVEAVKNETPEETPETVLPEDAVVIDPAVLVEYNEGFEGEVAVADLFMSVANTYLVDEEDPYEVSFPVSLYFVGENVKEQFDIRDILFPAESEDELPEEPETVALTSDSIVYQDVPVTAYFLPEETVAQEELLMEMGNDEVELLLDQSYTIAVDESKALSGAPNWTQSKEHTWTQSGDGAVTFDSATTQNVTITGSRAGTVNLTHTYQHKFLGSWTTSSESTTVTVLAPEANEIRFDLNGGVGTTPASIPFTQANEDITLPAAGDITRDDYTLLGWAEHPNVNFVYDRGTNGPIYPLSGNYVPGKLEAVTLYAVWAQSSGVLREKLKLAVRVDGTTPDEPSIQNAAYYTLFDAVVPNILTYIIPAHTVSTPSKVGPCLTAEFRKLETQNHSNIPGYDSETQYIEWYVIKRQANDDTWHVDGVVKNRSKVTLYYNGNGNTGGLAPDSNEYFPGTNVAVSGNTKKLTKTGYTFAGWNTETDGSGTDYAAGNTIQVSANTTLYAKWVPSNATMYVVEYYLETGDEYILTDREDKNGRTGATVSTATPGVVKTYPGYELDTSIDGTVASGVIAGDGSLVLKLYYVKDESAKHSIGAEIEYYIAESADKLDEAVKYGDTVSVDAEESWIGQAVSVTASRDTNKAIVGYEFHSTDGNNENGSSTFTLAANVATDTTAKNVLKVYYVKDETQTQPTSYTVKHVVGGVEQVEDTEEYTGTAWINDNPAMIAIEEGSLAQNTYTGYTFSAMSVEEGTTEVESGTVITLTYVKDDSQTKALTYTVQYYLDGQPAGNAETYAENVWVNSDQTTLAVQAGSVNTANKFEGYTFDYSDPATIPGTVANGTVIRVYYATDVIGTDPENPNTPDGIPDKYQATVTFNVVNGTWTGGTTSQSAVVTLTKDGVPAAAADGGVYQITDGDVPNGTPNAGYLNTGAWRDGRNPANAIINGDTTFTFTYALIPVIPPVTPPGGGGGGGGTTIPDGPTPLVPDPGTTIADQDVPLAAPGLNNTDHFDYIKGYVIDGQILVRPEANITRAEVATIFFRLMTKEFREANWATENDFTDVKKGDWYNNAISTCTRAGILKGYEDGTFKPNQTISREEFAAIAARFASEEVPAGGMFKDIAGRWSEKDIERAAAMGWIKGSNGLFRPVDKITRAEVIVIVNRMLDRVPDADHMLPDMKTFADNTPDMWWYADVQEATNSHEYDRAEDGVTGIWTSLLPEQDWAALEEEWATAADANVADVAPKLGTEGEKPEEGAKEPETAGGSDGNGEE